MVAKLIDGNALSKKIRGEIFERTKKITASKGQKPVLNTTRKSFCELR